MNVFRDFRKTKNLKVENVPKQLRDHPIYLMLTTIKLAKRHGISKPKQQKNKRIQLHLPHYVIMACLDENGPLSQQELSEKLHIDPSDLVGMIDALETNKYVLRKRDSTDRRRYVVSLTERGDSELPGFSIREGKLQNSFLSPLTSKEKLQFNKALLKLINHYSSVEDSWS